MLDVGATVLDDKNVQFRVWAPFAETVEVRLDKEGSGAAVRRRLNKERGDLFGTEVPGKQGLRYEFLLDGKKLRPDPVSRFQPRGVHGPSEVVDPLAFSWSDRHWDGISVEDLVIYELHVGTFTKEGSFGGVAGRIGYLARRLGATAIELMPVAQFPGERNWGYDGVFPYAPQNSYGGPTALKALVDLCHANGLAVILDVVYNHLGPEGNVLGDFGPYFTKKYATPWGAAVNFDDAGSDRVRKYFIDNALYWLSEYHIDGLRLDAIHGIFDFSARHILKELADAVHELQGVSRRRLHLIAESDLNDPKVVLPEKMGGYELDAQWSDDFHHAVHACLTGERTGYYQDFGQFRLISKAMRDGFVYDGKYSRYRNKSYGAPSTEIPGGCFVIFLQNHDQVGNRPDGARLTELVEPEALRVAAGLLLLAPYTPMLFMGEEYGEENPFYYFVDHRDPELLKAVREGRKRDLGVAGSRARFVDPGSPSTFAKSKLNLQSALDPRHSAMLDYYSRLIQIRREHPSLKSMRKDRMTVFSFDECATLVVRRWEPSVEDLLLAYVFGSSRSRVGWVTDGLWAKIFESSSTVRAEERDRSSRGVPTREPHELGNLELPPYSFTIFQRRSPAQRGDEREEGEIAKR